MNQQPADRIPYPLLALFVVLAMGIAGVAYRYHLTQKQAVEHEVQNQLLTIADMKVKQISDWRTQIVGEAQALLANRMSLAAMDRLIAGRSDARERADVLMWLYSLCSELRYAGVAITDTQGHPILFTGRQFGSDRNFGTMAQQVIRGGLILFQDLHQEDPGGAIHLGLVIPLRFPDQPQAFGALMASLDPQEYLYRLMQAWPVPSATAESLLVRRDGDEVVYLNELRHRGHSALQLRVPISRPEMPEVQAAQGFEGSVEGADYRGVPVYAAVRAVPGTEWKLVAKVDAREVLGPLARRSVPLGVGAISLILAAAAGVMVLWRRQQLRFYRAQYEAEMRRRALAGHYDYLTRFANDIILLADSEGRLIEANDRATGTYGYTREELLKLTLRDLRHPSEAASFEKQFRLSGERGSLLFETVQQTKGGLPIPVEVSARVIAVGEKTYRQAIIRDISERKAMHEELRRTVETLRTIIEASPAGIVSYTPELVISTWNRGAEQIFGWTAEEVVGRALPSIPREAEEEAAALHGRVLEGETVAVQRVAGVRKDGTRVPISIWAAPLYGEDGRVTGIMAIILDVTEHRKAEEALRRSEERFRRVVENMPDGILVSSAMQLRYLNPAAVRMLGCCCPDELIGESVLDRIHPDERAEVVGRHGLIEEGIPMPRTERRFLRTDGSEFPAEVSTVLVDYDQKPSVLVFFRDLTESKQVEEERARLEQQLLQAQKMDSIGRLAGGVAHDFNNLLTVISGFSTMVLEELAPDDPLRDALEEIRAAGERATALTQQLLAFSRKQMADRKPINLNEVVEESGKMLRRLIGEDIAIITRLDPEIGYVMADRSQMHQVLMNLAVNARDALPSGGQIIIETAPLQLSDTTGFAPDLQPGPYVSFSVTDTGVGMGPDILSKIFDPFFTTKPTGAGTGLGLATVYGIVRQSGGSIQVSSEPGKGSTFRILLPRIEAAGPAPEEAGAAAATLGGTETILVVEDQPEVRKLGTTILVRAGYTVLEAGDGAEALALAERHSGPIDLLMTDIVMPGMSGFQLANRLLALRPGLSVLYVSGYAADAIARESVEHEVLPFLPKPFQAPELLRKIREVLGERQEVADADVTKSGS